MYRLQDLNEKSSAIWEKQLSSKRSSLFWREIKSRVNAVQCTWHFPDKGNLEVTACGTHTGSDPYSCHTPLFLRDIAEEST